jgi:histidinol dehydrogenase
LFIGECSAAILGDYSSGLNHVLPTNRGGRFTGGLGIKDFLKFQTTLRVDNEGLRSIGPVAERLAKLEGLDKHAGSIKVRMKKKNSG